MRVVFAMAGIVAVARLGVAQDAPSKPRFDVASIRAFVPRPGPAGVVLQLNPERLSLSTALRGLIQRAYGLENYQLVGPDSLLATVWTVAANAAPGTTQAQQNLMLQGLLEERFQLTFHHEMKEVKVYNLVIAKGGVKLKESIPTDGCSMGASSVERKACGPVSGQVGIAKASGEGPSFMLGGPSGVVAAKNYTLLNFASGLRSQAGEIVLDKTGIEGAYDIRMVYSVVDLRSGRPFDDAPGPTVGDALVEQLGLKLEPAKAMIEMTVIDHVDAMPTEN